MITRRTSVRVSLAAKRLCSHAAIPAFLSCLALAAAQGPAAGAEQSGPRPGGEVRPLLDLVLPAFDPAHAGLGKLTADDDAQIRNAITRVHFSIDTRNYGAIGEVFTKDGVLDFQWGRGQGPKAISELLSKHRPEETGVRHHGLNELVIGNNDGTATVFAYLLVIGVGDPQTGNPIAPRIIGAGVETFRLERESGTWRITMMLQDQTVLDPSIAKPEDIRFTALAADARAKERGGKQ